MREKLDKKWLGKYPEADLEPKDGHIDPRELEILGEKIKLKHVTKLISLQNTPSDFRIEYTELDALTEINEIAQSYAGAENKACPQTPAGDPTLISTNGKGGVNK